MPPGRRALHSWRALKGGGAAHLEGGEELRLDECGLGVPQLWRHVPVGPPAIETWAGRLTEGTMR